MKKQMELPEHRNYHQRPRTAHCFDTEHRNDCGNFEPTMTKQADAESADINYIMARYTETGHLPTLINENPSYGDFSDVGSFQEALEIVRHAEAQFAALPAKIRSRFKNDPAQMLEFVNDPANVPEAVELGLAEERPEVSPPASRQANRTTQGKTQSTLEAPGGE